MDTDVENARSYFYYVQALDADGFKSRWSNFNSDCDFDGPDCVMGLPLNPDPPGTPTGVAVVDPGTGSQLTVRWNPNPENDLDFYTLFWGTEPGQYPFSREVGNANVGRRDTARSGSAILLCRQRHQHLVHERRTSRSRSRISPRSLRGSRRPRSSTTCASTAQGTTWS